MKTSLHWIVVLAIILVISAGYYFGNSEIKSFSLGVLGSLVASAIYSLSNYYFEKPLGDQVKSLKETESKLSDLYNALQGREGLGVTRVEKKYDASSQFWFETLESSHSQIDLMGNCLSGWLANNYRGTFKNCLVAALQRGVKIRIIILNPYSDMCQQKSEIYGKKYKDECIRFIDLIKEVLSESSLVNVKGSLELRGSDGKTITYMSIITDRAALISPYMTSRKTMRPLVMRVECHSVFYDGYRDDFEEAFRSCAQLVLIPQSANVLREPQDENASIKQRESVT